MTANALTIKNGRAGGGLIILSDYVAAALTTGTKKKQWVCPVNGYIEQVVVHNGAAGSGGTSDIIDVNKAGTTIFTTQGRRPTQLSGDTLAYTVGEIEVTQVQAGDIISYDVDQVCSTGSTENIIQIRIRPR